MKKKFLIFIGVVFLFSGLRLFDNGLLNIGRDGVFTVYNRYGVEAAVYESDNQPLLDRFSSYTRLDTFGTLSDVYTDLKKLHARVSFTEQVDDIQIIYAYSPFITKHETVHGKKVNVMVAVGGGTIAYGCPLLLGSY